MARIIAYMKIIILVTAISNCQDDDFLDSARLEANLSKDFIANLYLVQNGNPDTSGPFRSGDLDISLTLNQKLEGRPKIEIKQNGLGGPHYGVMAGSGTGFTYTYTIQPSLVPPGDKLLPYLEQSCTTYALINAVNQRRELDCPALHKDGPLEITIYIGKRDESSFQTLIQKEIQVITTPDSIPDNNSENIYPTLDRITVGFNKNMDTSTIPVFMLGVIRYDGQFVPLSLNRHTLNWLNERVLEIVDIPGEMIILAENVEFIWFLGEMVTEQNRTLYPFSKRFRTTTQNIVFKSPAVNNYKPSNARFSDKNPVANDWIVGDTETGLAWLKCLIGTSANAIGDDCLQNPVIKTLDDAVALCNALNTQNNGSGYGNRNKWHVPSIRELMTLAHYNSTNPYHVIMENHFPNMSASKYNTITFNESDNSKIWSFNFALGLNELVDIDNNILVQCVDSSNVDSYSGERSYSAHPTLSRVHIDNVTGKEWYQVTNDFYSHSQALNLCDNSTTKHPDDPSRTLRLPDIYELFSIARFSESEELIVSDLRLDRPYWTNRQVIDGYESLPGSNLFYTYSFLQGVEYHEENLSTMGYTLCILDP